MITVLQRGAYKLIETKDQTKILILDAESSYAWINAAEIGEILVLAYKYEEECVLSTGNYRLYKVENEPGLTDQLHLELSIGLGKWQGYLLPTGFPTDTKNKSRIIPTSELITIPNEEASPQVFASYRPQ